MYKRFFEGKKALSFDLDGTLVNTVPLWEEAFDKIFLKTALIYPESMPEGLAMLDRWKYIVDIQPGVSVLPAEDLCKKTQKVFMESLLGRELELMPGFWDFVLDAKKNHGMKLCLATNTDKEVALRILTKTDLLGVFDFMVFGDEVVQRKPGAAMYMKLLELTALHPSEMLAFEDSPVGAQAAHAAGLDFIVLWNSITPQREYPDSPLAYIVNFEGFAGCMDKSQLDVLNDVHDKLQALGKI